MIGIDKKQLEKSLLARLEDEEEWSDLLERTEGDWRFEPDADYDDGCWLDCSQWLWEGDYLGYRVEVSATPGDRWARYEEVPPIGDVRRVRVLG